MAIIDKITLKDSNNQDVIYDIGASSTNVMYDNNTNIKTKIDGKIESQGGSLAGTVAGSVDSQSSFSNITAGNSIPTICGKINALNSEKNNHINAKINTSTGTHGLRYYENKLQYDDNGSWQTIETGGSLDIIVGDVIGAQANPSGLKALITWSDPEDVVLGGTTVATWAGTVLVRKVGSAPTSRTDGTEVLINTTKNRYSGEPFQDTGLSSGTIYYYRFFTLTQEKMTDPSYSGDIGTSLMINPSFDMPTWTEAVTGGTRLTNVLNAYYNDEITLDYIKQYWHVGDVARVSISAISTSGIDAFENSWLVDETHHTQQIDLVILDFDHDELETSINGHTKTLITVQVLNLLYSGDTPPSIDTPHLNTFADSEFASIRTSAERADHEHFYNWNTCQRRKWCNGGFYNSIYGYLHDNIKLVKKKYFSWVTEGVQEENDYVWLPSSMEVGGETYVSNAKLRKIGTQYDYFKTFSNTYKYPKWGSGWLTSPWWTRDLSNNSNTCYVVHLYDGTLIGEENDANKFGISPCFAL